jgi:hypothetical protein
VSTKAAVTWVPPISITGVTPSGLRAEDVTDASWAWADIG